MALPIPMTFSSLAMEQPLNQAHEEERKGYSYLQTCCWDDAEKSFLLAAVLMRKAMQGVDSVKILQPLQMQADKFEHMKNVIDIKRKENSKSIVTDTPRKSSGSGSNNTHQEMIKPTTVMEEMQNYNHSDLASGDATTFESVGTESLTTATNSTAKEKINVTRENNKWQVIHLHQLIEDRETDSLLQALMNPSDREQDPLTATCKKIPKNLDTKIEEYREQIDIFRDVAIRLVKELESTEKENSSLRQINMSLEDEISTLTDRLMMLDETPSPLRNCSDEDNELTIRATTGVDPMINSIIFQPRSFFEFKEKEKDVMMELSPATDENLDMLRKEVESVPRIHSTQTHHNHHSKRERSRKVHNHLEYIDNSIKYEDLDNGPNCEVSEIVSNLSETESDITPPSYLVERHVSLAGLPPLSPVHFIPDNKDIVFAQRYHDDLCGKLS